MQHLIDVRNQLDKYAAPDKVDWHIACINNRWTKRALASAGFGYPATTNANVGFERWKAIFSVAEIGGESSAAAAAQRRDNEEELRRQRTYDSEQMKSKSLTDGGVISRNSDHSPDSDLGKDLVTSKAYSKGSKVAALHGLDRPLFHIDLTNALQSAIANVEARGLAERKGELI